MTSDAVFPVECCLCAQNHFGKTTSHLFDTCRGCRRLPGCTEVRWRSGRIQFGSSLLVANFLKHAFSQECVSISPISHKRLCITSVSSSISESGLGRFTHAALGFSRGQLAKWLQVQSSVGDCQTGWRLECGGDECHRSHLVSSLIGRVVDLLPNSLVAHAW